MSKRTQQTIYTAKSGAISPSGYSGTPVFVGADYINGTYYLRKNNSTRVSYSSLINIYHLNIDIKFADIEYIMFGSYKFKFLVDDPGTDGTAAFSNFWVANQKLPASLYMTRPSATCEIYPSIQFAYTQGRYELYAHEIYLFGRFLGGTETTLTTYQLSDNIPITISTYIE